MRRYYDLGLHVTPWSKRMTDKEEFVATVRDTVSDDPQYVAVGGGLTDDLSKAKRFKFRERWRGDRTQCATNAAREAARAGQLYNAEPVRG